MTQLQHSDTMNCNSGAESSTDADVDLTVGDIVSEHINDIMGTNSKPNCPQSNDFVSLALPLDAMISDKLKNQIWGNEFIDLSVLIDIYTPQVQLVRPLCVVGKRGMICR